MLEQAQVAAWKWALKTSADKLAPVMELYRPFVDGLDVLPADGRFLLVGNHTQFAASEIVLIPYFVRQRLGRRVRPLADRQFGRMPGPQLHLMDAFGAVIGSPESAAQLMRADQPILVFPGGGREIAKFKGEEYRLRWQNRAGFARVAIEHDYPIVTAALVGGDDVYRSLMARDSPAGQVSTWITEKLGGPTDSAFPLVRGLGPTLIPRPQRMYLRFSSAIPTSRPEGTRCEEWITEVKREVQEQLEHDLEDLQKIRAEDPYRNLNPLAWRAAVMP
ncbi:glycerol acyltransferase [Mycobacterium sp. MS1601]|uniref:lysophospholipid acyltransferase family protein n=1 Tax=Mycobacterium sp. MS1601 TaxID=1936029 RepID=UPI00097942B6|nr:lysophospholipid acyltransferase family protein [Mycobacterium sp. MS1601]AQA03215.1 glycerol acyltransferase [Mycobacterium sp. MS1601]